MSFSPPNYEPMATTDVVFRYIFSSAGSEDGLLAFINAVQKSANRPLAEKIEVQNPFNLQSFLGDKGSVLDIKAVDINSRTFDIEMQTALHNAFESRILYYWSRLYADQIGSGDDYSFLNPVVSIVLARF